MPNRFLGFRRLAAGHRVDARNAPLPALNDDLPGESRRQHLDLFFSPAWQFHMLRGEYHPVF